MLVPRIRPPRLAVGATVLIAGFTLAWTVTTEVYAANGESTFSKNLYAILPKPANWLDLTTQQRGTVFLGQAIRDVNPINLLEFWNRSLTGVWSLDASAPGPGATTTPNLVKPDGTLTPPHTAFVVATPGVDVAARQVGPTVAGYTLSPPRREPQAADGADRNLPRRLDGGVRHVFPVRPPGGPERAASNRPLAGRGGAAADVRSIATASVGPVAVSRYGEAMIGRVTDTASDVLHSCQTKTLVLETPPRPWRAEVKIAPTFVPASSTRHLPTSVSSAPSSSFTYVPDE